MNESTHDTVPQLQPTELAKLSSPARIVDVREATEFNGDLGHVPGAELVPLATLEEAAKSWPKDETLVMVCRSGARSSKGARLLVNLGFKNVLNLAGGTLAYTSAGLPVERQ